MNLAFISRHAPTPEQVALATEQGFTLHHVGDADAFAVGNEFVHEAAARLDITFEGVVVIHPAPAPRRAGAILQAVAAGQPYFHG